MTLDALIAHWQHAFESDEAIANAKIPRVLMQPGGAWYWSRSAIPGGVFNPEFARFIESELSAARKGTNL
jgi:hypothetical protein